MRLRPYFLFFLLCIIFLHSNSVFSSEKVEYHNKKIQNISQLYHLSDSLFLLHEFERSKEINKKNLESIIFNYSKNSQERVFGLYKLALCELKLGNYHLSDSLLSEAIVMQNNIDSTSLMSGRLWYMKSEVQNLLCDCKEVIPIAEKAVDLLEKNLSNNHPEVAYALEILGFVLAHDYRYNESVDILKRSLKILEYNYGTESLHLSRSLSFLSRVGIIICEFESTESYIERGLQCITGNDYLSKVYLADIYYRAAFRDFMVSDYEAALKDALISVEASTNSYGEYHPKTANYSSLLSRIYLQLGKYELAEPLMLKIKNIFEKTFTTNDPVRYYAYINLGELYIAQKRYTEAEYYFSRFLEIPNIKKSLQSGILANLAEIYFELGNLKKAEELCHEVIDFRTKQLGRKHPNVALTQKLLASVYFKQNKFMESEKTYLSVLEVFRENYGINSLYVASTLYNLAHLYLAFNMPLKAEECLVKTINIRKTALQAGHPLVSHTYLDLALSQIMLDKTEESFENINRGLDDRKDFMTHVFQYASSEQKLLYIKDNPLIYNPLLILAMKNQKRTLIQASCEMILYGKGYVIDALSLDKAISVCEEDKEISLLVDKYSDVCTRISAMALVSNQNINKFQETNNLEKLYKTRDSLEAVLSMNCANFNVSNIQSKITTQDISSVLDANTLYIDYLKYQPQISNNNKTNYLAYSINNKNEVSMIDLGDASLIDSLISETRNNIEESQYQIYSKQAFYLENELQNTTHALCSLLIKPFRGHLAGKQKIIISPDSDLNLIPFEIFINDKREYLVENYEVSYVSSGRDLLKDQMEFNEARGFLVIASPNFDSKNNSQKFFQPKNIVRKHYTDIPPSRSMDTLSSCFENAFTPLSHSREEGQQLIDLYNKKISDKESKLYYSSEATTSVLTDLQEAPRYLHLSTHGYFCQEDDNVYIKNPLLRSGLAFTGANYTIIGNVKTPFTFDDGLLTALEVTGLNLIGTELVTLSACETGIGETVNGEGVFGLCRAFQIAGAKSILMSMWKIPDKETSDLMIRFYEKLFDGISKQKALRNSILEILQESRKKYNHGHPYLWGGFILRGNPN